jgi:hypothetical protein
LGTNFGRDEPQPVLSRCAELFGGLHPFYVLCTSRCSEARQVFVLSMVRWNESE